MCPRKSIETTGSILHDARAQIDALHVVGRQIPGALLMIPQGYVDVIALRVGDREAVCVTRGAYDIWSVDRSRLLAVDLTADEAVIELQKGGADGPT